MNDIGKGRVRIKKCRARLVSKVGVECWLELGKQEIVKQIDGSHSRLAPEPIAILHTVENALMSCGEVKKPSKGLFYAVFHSPLNTNNPFDSPNRLLISEDWSFSGTISLSDASRYSAHSQPLCGGSVC